MFSFLSKVSQKSEFEELLLENINSMYYLALKLTKNTDDAQDLVQEVSLRAFRFFHKYEKGTNFKAWILTIVRNLFINSYRKKVKEPYKIDYDEFAGSIGSFSFTGVEEEIFGESMQIIIDSLPENLRTTIILFYVDGLAYKEMAKVMSCPIGTVMSRLFMARKMIKAKLTKMKPLAEDLS